MGDFDSDLYAPLMCSSYYMRNGESARGLALSHRWIQPLRRMSQAAPDNYRVAGVLTGMLGLVGEGEAMRDSMRTIVSRIERNPDFSSTALYFAMPGVLKSGTLEDLDSLGRCRPHPGPRQPPSHDHGVVRRDSRRI
jgi:hypothetical protein